MRRRPQPRKEGAEQPAGPALSNPYARAAQKVTRLWTWGPQVYTTAYEQNAVRGRAPDGPWGTLVQEPRALWPDTLRVAADGYLWFSVNQLRRQARFHEGQDQRQMPSVLFRTRIDG